MQIQRYIFVLLIISGVILRVLGSAIYISSIQELQQIGTDDYPLYGSYYLTQDIDASETAEWNDNKGFKPIGSSINHFSGAFDGQGHVITGLVMDRGAENFVALFGAVSGEVKNLSLRDVSISGNTRVGGLVGLNVSGGTISNSSVTGEVTGNEYVGALVGFNQAAVQRSFASVEVTGVERVGGLVGTNWPGTISNSYATGAVTGQSDVGGLVGENYGGSLFHCFSSGKVSGDDDTGGLVGFQFGPEAIACYWDIQTSEQDESAGVEEDRSTEEMTYPYAENTYTEWDFENIWVADSDGVKNNGYPYLQEPNWYDSKIVSCDLSASLPLNQPFSMTLRIRNTGKRIWKASEGIYLGAVGDEDSLAPPHYWRVELNYDILPGSLYTFTIELNPQQEGTFVTEWQMLKEGEFWFGEIFSQEVEVGGPIGISSVEELQLIGNDPDYPLHWCYYLAQDIDASGTETWNDGEGFEPIDQFSGVFDGKGYSIEGLIINRPAENHIGLFNILSGEIKHCFLKDCIITGNRFVGGLVGWNEGIISDSAVTGFISGDICTGGLVGIINGGTILNSYAMGAVSGGKETGGLVGTNEEGSISDSYSTLQVTGEEDVGGLVGYNYEGSIIKVYSLGQVEGETGVGGLIGSNVGGSITDSYWDMEKSLQIDSAGGLGRFSENMTYPHHADTFMGWNFSEIWELDDNYSKNWGYPYLRAILPSMIDARIQQWPQASSIIYGESLASSILTGGEALAQGSFLFEDDTIVPEAGIYEATVLFIPEDTLNYHSMSETVPVDVIGKVSITSVEELQLIGNDSDYPLHWHYYLDQDIDASNTDHWNNDKGFIPIGNDDEPFTGQFDGKGYSITGLVINRPNDDYVGLFGSLSGEVRNLFLKDVSISAGDFVGALVGFNEGALIRCSATGSVVSRNNSGGLVGYNRGSVSNTFAAVKVSGNVMVGGLVGGNENGSVSMSYAVGEVSGEDPVGGLVAWNNETVIGSYWNIETTGQNNSAGGEGRTTDDMTYPYSPTTFVDWDFSETWKEDFDYDNNNGYPFLQDSFTSILDWYLY